MIDHTIGVEHMNLHLTLSDDAATPRSKVRERSSCNVDQDMDGPQPRTKGQRREQGCQAGHSQSDTHIAASASRAMLASRCQRGGNLDSSRRLASGPLCSPERAQPLGEGTHTVPVLRRTLEPQPQIPAEIPGPTDCQGHDDDRLRHLVLYPHEVLAEWSREDHQN